MIPKVSTPTRVLVVDDSPTARAAIASAIAAMGATLEVVGHASDQASALEACERLDPDIVTMDVHLGHDDGVEVTAAIMERSPRPILIVTSSDHHDRELIFRALEAGALDVVSKLPHPDHPDYRPRHERLLRTMLSLSKVPVVLRHRRHAPPPTPVMDPGRTSSYRRPALVVIGSSTGGPRHLGTLLGELPHSFSAPIVVVQHILSDLAPGLAAWLSRHCDRRVVLADRVRQLEPNTIYLATGDTHLALRQGNYLVQEPGPAREHQVCSIDHFFESVASVNASHVLGILLTGMGRDGALGLAALRRAGAVTVAQEPSTCAVDSMPSAAIAMGAATKVLSPQAIGRLLARSNSPTLP